MDGQGGTRGCPDMTGTPRALHETLRVVAVDGDTIRIAASRAAGCGACAVRKSCAAGTLGAMAEPGTFRLPRPAGLDVMPGDQVVVAMPASQFLGAAGLAYLFPALVLVIVVAGGAAVGLGDLALAGLSLPALALSLVPLWLAERRGHLAGALRIEAVLPGSTFDAGATAPLEPAG